MLPQAVLGPLRAHLDKVKVLHEHDVENGFGEVYLPYALERKYPDAAREWGWQYVFPAPNRSVDPRSGKERRHHLDEQSASFYGHFGFMPLPGRPERLFRPAMAFRRA